MISSGINSESYSELNKIENKDKKLYIILEHANLELTTNKKNPEIINSDEHADLIKKMGKSIEDYRPDVLHQCLLNLTESPLNKANLLQIFIRTKENVLIKINPKTKIPRTIKSFNCLMSQLLLKQSIRALNSSEVLLRIVKNPVTQYIPFNTKIISTNEKATLVNIDDYLKAQNFNANFAFVVGAMSKGDLNIDYNTETISISSYPLSAGIVCSKLCTAFEKFWYVI